MLSKVCSRSHGQPPGARSRAMMETARSNRSPVVGIATTVNEAERFSLSVVKCLIQKLRIVGDQAIYAPFGKAAHVARRGHGPGNDLPACAVDVVDQARLDQVVARQEGLNRKVSPCFHRVSSFSEES